MASVTAPTVSAPSQSQSEFVKAMAVTDATIFVAGSMLGSGMLIVSADIGVPVHYLWRSVEGNRPPPPPLPSH